MQRSVPLCLSFLLITASSRLVWSSTDPDEFGRHWERAVISYEAGRYDDALAEFKAAYEVRQLTRLLVNIGTAYRKLGKAKEALDSYNAYLKAEAHPEPGVKQKVDDYLRQTRAMIEATGSATSMQPPAAKPERSDRNKGPRMPPYATRFATVPSNVKANLNAIAGRAPDDLWAAGNDGTLLHYDGKRWLPSYDGWGGKLRHIAGSRPDDVWAVGRKGLSMHFDGALWHLAPSVGEADLADVWVNGPGDAWVIDESGAVQHFDGTDWFAQSLSGGQPGGLHLVAASQATSGPRWIVGTRGAIVRWDGKTLVKTLSGTQDSLYSVWQSAPDDAWAAGDHGTLLHFDGQTWKPAISPTKLELMAIWGTGASDVWAAGGGDDNRPMQGVILHYDGKAWSIAADALRSRLRALWGAGPMDVFAAGEDGAIYHYDGNIWSEMPGRTRETLAGLWGTSATDVWAIGDGGVVLHYDGSSWSTRWSRSRAAFRAIWETAADDVWAVGAGGAILHRDAAGWSVSESGTTEDLHAVWASSANDAWAAGRAGLLLHWDGTAWSMSKSGVKEHLTALWGTGPSDVWAGGEHTLLLHYDGRAWSATPSPLPGDHAAPKVTSIWGAAANDVWAVGDTWTHRDQERALLLHYDGTRWVDQPTSPGVGLTGVAGSGPKDVWIVGGRDYDACARIRRRQDSDPCPRLVAHYDGKTWRTESASATADDLVGVWSGGGEVWAVGEKGAIVKRSR